MCILSLTFMMCESYCTSPSFCCLIFLVQLSHCQRNPCSHSAFLQNHKVREVPIEPSILIICQHAVNCNVPAYFYVPILTLHETEALMAGNVNLIIFMGVVLCGLASGLCQFEMACWCIQNRRSLILAIAGCFKASLHACMHAQLLSIASWILLCQCYLLLAQSFNQVQIALKAEAPLCPHPPASTHTHTHACSACKEQKSTF